MSFLLKSIILLLPLLTMGLFGATSEVRVAGSEVEKNTKDWKNYEYADLHFAVELPNKPEKMHQDIAIPQTELKIISDTFMVEAGEEMVYLVSVWQYPKEIDLSDPESSLKDGFKGMLSALPSSEVLHSRVFEKEGNKCLEFKVKSETVHFEGFLMLVDHVLYQVFTVYKEGLNASKDISRFLESFHLINGEKKEPANKESNKESGVKTLKI